MKGDIFTQVGRFLMRPWKEGLGPRLRKAGYDELPYRSVGMFLFGSLLAAVLWYAYFAWSTYDSVGVLVTAILAPLIIILALVLVSFIGLFATWVYMDVKAFNRAQALEQNLPLFLREFSTNLKAGREFVDALENSTEEDMGPLHEDINILVVQIRSGKMIEKVFEDYIRKYDSPIVEETFQIILDAYKGGSSLADIIDKIAENLEVIFYLRREAIASVSSYVIFMSIVALMIAPLLFALSYNLLYLIHSLLTRVLAAGTSSFMPARISAININFDDFRLFSQLAIAVISGSAAAVIGIIRKGNLKGASVIIFIFVMISLVVYQVLLLLLTWMFNNLYNIG